VSKLQMCILLFEGVAAFIALHIRYNRPVSRFRSAVTNGTAMAIGVFCIVLAALEMFKLIQR
jgi:hypothetical protein